MPSPIKHRRKSLTDMFHTLEITPTSSQASATSSTAKRNMMKQRLRETISRGWPSRPESGEDVYLTIRSDGTYREIVGVKDPKKLFEKAAACICTIQDATKSLNDDQQNIISHEIHEAMIRAIFGSNLIEHAGLDLDLTVQICRKIFTGETVKETGERGADCQEALLELYSKKPYLKNLPVKHVLRSRNEVVQHARAFQHIINSFVVEKNDLSEDLIKETHRILVKGVPIIEENQSQIEPEEYGGIYRTIPVSAGNTNFSVPAFVPKHMTEMCANLKADIDKAEGQGVIDPFSLASKYSMEFVQVHPFCDGNGRMCRLILNAILCRFAGIVVPIGEQEEDRAEYIGIKRRASQMMEGHGEYASFVLAKASTRLREMKKRLKGKSRRN